MYRRPNPDQLSIENFYLPFGGKLSAENRWVKLAELIPWEEFEAAYADQFDCRQGAPAKRFRVALGALIIKERLKVSDEETIEQVKSFILNRLHSWEIHRIHRLKARSHNIKSARIPIIGMSSKKEISPMPKRITIKEHLSLDELEQRYRRSKDPIERSHYQIVWLLAQGKPTEEVIDAIRPK